MGFSLTHFTAISIFSALIIARISGEPEVLRHYPTDNDTAIITCVSEDDGAGLVWNYDKNEKNFNNGQKIDVLTNFQPKNPTSKNLTECAIWDSTKCFALWGNKSGWNVADSARMPMGPIFDYRWEGLEEIILEKSVNPTEYQDMGTVSNDSGTVIFSVRGSSPIHIFLCENKDPRNGHCFWITIGDSKGKRSKIRSCINGRENTGGSMKGENCKTVPAVVHGAEDVLDAYAWRTFRLEWNDEQKEIKIFNETEVEPFLERDINQWHPVSHLSMKSESLSRIRFHFYDYFVTKKNNTVISTEKFIIDDENFCVDVLHKLCPECKLNVTLVDDEGRDIPIANISGEGKSVHDKLVTWQSAWINATLPKFNSRLVKLEMVTILMKNEVKGLWAIDKFRRCKSVGGLRNSTITIGRKMTAKCQKLSYTENIIVDSTSGKPNRDRDGPALKRRSRAAETTGPPYFDGKLEIYGADLENNSISLRLKPFHPTQHGIEQYIVSVKGLPPTSDRTYDVSQALECRLWEKSVCLENFPIPKDIISLDPPSESADTIVVSGQTKYGYTVKTWKEIIPVLTFDRDANKPTNPTWHPESHGIVTLKWGYPSLPKTKIEQFNITITRHSSRLLLHPDGNFVIQKSLVLEKVEKEYEKILQLEPSTDYTINIRSINQKKSDSNPVKFNISVPSSVNFDPKSELNVTNNGTWIELKIPAVVNATNATYIIVSMEGIWKCGTANNMTERIVRKFRVELGQSGNYTFNANESTTSSDMIDCFMNHGEKYKIFVKIVEETFNSTHTLPAQDITLPSMPQNQGSNLNLIIGLAIFLIFFFFCIIYKCRHKCRLGISEYEPPTIPDNNDHHTTFRTPVNPTPPSDGARNGRSTRQSPTDVVPHNPQSSLVRTDDFETHFKNSLDSGLLYSQYKKIPRGLIKPCEYGQLPENVQKNRYKNLIAYDDTRVILKKVGDDSYSDYINASYIQGYKKERAYIATQGPSPQTVSDFWRMIWEEEVRVICMLVNVKEDGKTQCEHYWPEVRSKAKLYGDILVTNMKQKVFADYTFRTFKLSSNKVHREVTHLHYTGWPDHGIPMYTQSLVSYLKKLQDTSTGNRPVVVHCSTGVGRTGTIILCDICLKQAFAEKTIDVPSVTARIRNGRANMVNSRQQYILAHLTIMESLVVKQTSSTVSAEKIRELRKNLPSHIRRLNDTVWQDRALHDLAASRTRPPSRDVSNNGISEPVSGIPSSVAKLEEYNGENNSINPVSVDGAKMKKQHLASRLPTASTLSEYWKLIRERRIELVVILERPDEKDTTSRELLSNQSIRSPGPHLKVEKKTLPIQKDYSIDKISLSDTSRIQKKEKPQLVTVLTCNEWGYNEEREPLTADALVSLWQASEEIPRNENSPTLVLCRDGVTGCGLYLALSFLLERMAKEDECDVISAVRAVRRSKPEFVRSLNQFEYLYDAAVQYIQCSDT